MHYTNLGLFIAIDMVLVDIYDFMHTLYTLSYIMICIIKESLRSEENLVKELKYSSCVTNRQPAHFMYVTFTLLNKHKLSII